MKNIIKLLVLGIVIVGSYFLGTTQSKTEVVTHIPNGYIALDQCIPLADVARCFIGEYDYPCFELKDVGNQLDDPENRSYTDIIEEIKTETEY